MLAGELSRTFSTPGELRCGEYSFNLKMNPLQHPIYDANIHHLLALFTSLCHGCGGVVYLVTHDVENVTHKTFQVYKERLLAVISAKLKCLALPANMVQVSLLLGTHRSWAAVLVKKSCKILTYPPVETRGIWKPVNFEIDLFGQMHTKPLSATQSPNFREVASSSFSPIQAAANSVLRPPYTQENLQYQTEPEISSASVTAPVTVHPPSDDTEIPQVDFSTCQRLDWADNTKDCQKYVNITEVKTDDIVASCPMWKPTKPMKITPDEQSIRYLFQSETDMEKNSVYSFHQGTWMYICV